jgi:hypothetical protein
VLAVLAMVALVGVGGTPARAEGELTGQVQRVSWWTNRLAAQPTIAPAQVEVAFGTDGKASSVAAMDIAVPVGPVQSLSISLTELAGTANQIGHITVCLATPGWKTVNAGALEDAPKMDCTDKADLTRSLDGNWLGDIGALVPKGGTASLGLILVSDLDLPVTIGASVQISTMAIIGQAGDAGSAPTPTTAPPAGQTPTTGFDSSFVEPSSGYVAPAGDDFAAPALETPNVQGPAAPAPTPTTIAEAPAPLLPASFASETKPWGRILVLVPLAVGIGFAGVYGRRLADARIVS